MDYTVAEPLLEKIAQKIHPRHLESFSTTLLHIDQEVYGCLVEDTETNSCFNVSNT